MKKKNKKYATEKENIEYYWNNTLSGREKIDLLNKLYGENNWSRPIPFETKKEIYYQNPLHLN